MDGIGDGKLAGGEGGESISDTGGERGRWCTAAGGGGDQLIVTGGGENG